MVNKDEKALNGRQPLAFKRGCTGEAPIKASKEAAVQRSRCTAYAMLSCTGL